MSRRRLWVDRGLESPPLQQHGRYLRRLEGQEYRVEDFPVDPATKLFPHQSYARVRVKRFAGIDAVASQTRLDEGQHALQARLVGLEIGLNVPDFSYKARPRTRSRITC